jgi:hypothetical protein
MQKAIIDTRNFTRELLEKAYKEIEAKKDTRKAAKGA